MGAAPRQYDLALDLTRLDRVVAYDPGDMTLSVEAGTPLRRIESALAEHRQFLPLVVPFMDRATAGGTIASGVDSPLRQFYGTARDYVLGIEFVTGDAAAAKSGGRVVKNVSGYDLHKLMIGALGTLGVLTRINFRTYPLPAATRTIVATFDSAAPAVELRHAIARSPLRPLVFEIVSPTAAELLARDGFPSNRGWSVITGFAGTAKALERCAHDLREMAEQNTAAALTVINEEQPLGASARTSEFAPLALASSRGGTILKLSVLPSTMHVILDAAAKAADAAGLPWAAVARGVGIIYFALLPTERNQEALTRVARVTNEIFTQCAALEGNATIPWCPAGWKTALPIWGPERAGLGQMRALKKVFDPHDVLSPGRFMGGI
jgi:glycolate oxidase FAD binding subunit